MMTSKRLKIFCNEPLIYWHYGRMINLPYVGPGTIINKVVQDEFILLLPFEITYYWNNDVGEKSKIIFIPADGFYGAIEKKLISIVEGSLDYNDYHKYIDRK